MTTVLITVGSTQFSQLTGYALGPSFARGLASLGITELVVQVGTAPLKPEIEAALASGTTYSYDVLADSGASIKVTVFRFTKDAHELDALIAKAAVVVSHAGSGTILQVLRRASPPALVAVPNPSLMDNHQQELANALEADGYLSVAGVGTLLTVIARLLAPSAPKPRPFPAADPSRFANILDEVAGFA